jgi:hypothetical protein
MTLKQLIEQHPEWADLHIAVPGESDELDYVSEGVSEHLPNWRGSVYPVKDEFGITTLVFAPN